MNHKTTLNEHDERHNKKKHVARTAQNTNGISRAQSVVMKLIKNILRWVVSSTNGEEKKQFLISINTS